jgi:diguanylate cyclase
MAIPLLSYRAGSMAEKTSELDEFKRTAGFATTAFRFMSSNRNPAYPRFYEVWYTYAAGYNRKLNRAINDALKSSTRIPSEFIEKMYYEFISPARIGDELVNMGDQMSDSVGDLMKLVEESSGNLGEYGTELRDAASRLSGPGSSREQVTEVVQRVLSATKVMEVNNEKLETQLSESRHQIAELQAKLERARTESITDELTGLKNRRHFDIALDAAIALHREEGQPLCVVLCDIDHFKNFNDTHGHQTGDQVLKLVGLTIAQTVKGRDIASRYGGEEFAIILPGTEVEGAGVVADHLREAVMHKELVKRSTGETIGRVTMSFGVAMLNDSDNSKTIVGRADACLYQSKHDGRNMVTTEVNLREDQKLDVA